VSDKALLMNLMYDHRVQPERALRLQRCFRYPLDLAEIARGVNDYFTTRVRESSSPDYESSFNSSNFIPFATAVADGVSEQTELVRVLDLTGLQPLYQWACATQHPTAKLFQDAPSTQWVTEERMGSQASPDDRRRFVEAVFLALWDRHQAANSGTDPSLRPFQPIWAAPWKSFEIEGYLGPEGGDDSPPGVPRGKGDRWLEVFGIARPSVGRSLILLRYKIEKRVNRLIRPTQLDSGYNAFHFPSWRDANVAEGGYPMDLGRQSKSLISEWIHMPIEHRIADWDAAGRRYSITRQVTPSGLREQRVAHHELMRQRYPSLGNWMPVAI